MEIPSGKRLVLFDGTCNFCNGAVLFIIDRDPAQQFVFAPLQSDLGQRVLSNMGGRDPELDSVVLVEGERISTHSTAALRVALRLSGPWPLLGMLGYLVPRFLRDPLYRAFARRRYVWFGKRETCRVPTPELRQRFLALS
jgi:predicted DCC family thiol-disulfide oxidoreductase YuxK